MKEDFIRRKERWAKKMSTKERSIRPNAGRLPPGQHEVSNFPVLDLGVHPKVSLGDWQLKIHGEVEKPITLNWNQFMELPQFRDTSDFHCVTTWSQFNMEFEGVAFYTLADLVKPTENASHIFFIGYDEYTTNTTLEACMDDDVMIAHSWNGHVLTLEHGGPARMIIPKLYAWKGAKFVKEIIFRDHDELGFWENRGYSNTANPFIEDRFA